VECSYWEGSSFDSSVGGNDMLSMTRRALVGLTIVVAGLLGLGTAVSSAAPVGVLATPTCDRSVTYSSPYGLIWVPAAPNWSVTCNMVRGNVSQAVGQLQHTMNECYPTQLQQAGVYPLVVDQNFGGNTQRGLKAVQSAIGTTVDGIYGPNTRNAMRFIDVEAWPIACRPFR